MPEKKLRPSNLPREFRELQLKYKVSRTQEIICFGKDTRTFREKSGYSRQSGKEFFNTRFFLRLKKERGNAAFGEVSARFRLREGHKRRKFFFFFCVSSVRDWIVGDGITDSPP